MRDDSFLKRRLIQRAEELQGTPLSFHKDITAGELKEYIDRIESNREIKRIKKEIAKANLRHNIIALCAIATVFAAYMKTQ